MDVKIIPIPDEAIKFTEVDLDIYLDIDISKLKNADVIRIKLNDLRALHSRQGLSELGELLK